MTNLYKRTEDGRVTLDREATAAEELLLKLDRYLTNEGYALTGVSDIPGNHVRHLINEYFMARFK
jgi:hypothetical protein